MPRGSGETPLPAATILCLLAGYFLLHVAVRVTVSSSLELDEAEQLVLGQTLSWGYGSKPPLYSWLQFGFFRLFGESVLALSLLKNLLLFGTYLFTFLAAQRATSRADTAMVGALSLLLIPQIAWESQRDLTHSVLATTLAALTLYLFLRLGQERRTALYMAFGVTVGLGLLAKFNFALLPLVLVLAGLTLPGARPALVDRRCLLSLAAMLAVASGYGWWFLANSDAVLAQSGTLRVKTTLPYWRSVLTGNASLVQAALAFGGTALLLIAAVFWRPGKDQPTEEDRHREQRRLLGRALLLTLLLLEVGVIVFRVTHFKDRWLQPLLFYAPVWLALTVAARPGRGAMRIFLGLCLTVCLTVLLLLPARPLLAASRNAFDAYNIPYDRFAGELRRAGFDQGLIVAENGLVGGNLRLHLPGSTVVAVGLPQPGRLPAGHCLIAWDATETPEPPSKLLETARALQLPVDPGRSEILAAPYHFAGEPPRMARLGIIRCQAPANVSSSSDRP